MLLFVGILPYTIRPAIIGKWKLRGSDAVVSISSSPSLFSTVDIDVDILFTVRKHTHTHVLPKRRSKKQGHEASDDLSGQLFVAVVR